MSWNNGNGQGNGQSYGGDDVYGRLNNTKEVGGARFPYIEAGNHKLALCSLEEFNPQSPKVRALFKVLESRTMQVGSFCVKIWNLLKPPYKQGMTTEADEFADFMIKLKGAKHGYPIGNDIRTLLKTRPAEQLARGSVIDCVGIVKGQKGYVSVHWNTVQQSPQDIAAMRQRLEAEGIPSTGPSQGAPQQAQPPQGYGPPMQPPTSQYTPPGQFGAAPPQWGPAPQQPAPAPQQGWSNPPGTGGSYPGGNGGGNPW